MALWVAAVLATWASSESGGDLFMSLAGGRDVVQGKLGAPDDWAFTTGGRVWINQNWLSHLLIYSSWRLGGEPGLLTLKAALLAAMGALLFLLARRRSGHGPVAAMVSAGIVAACFHFVLLRPNLLTLTLVPLALLLLHAAFERRRLIGWTVPLMALWSNLHGGFVLGLAMIGLWTTCVLIEDWRRKGPASLGKDWPLALSLVACVAVCVLSPFGLLNLKEPLSVATNPGWRLVPEWLPLLANDRLPFPWEFFIVLGLVLLAGAAFLLSRPPSRTARKPAASAPRAAFGPIAFDLIVLGAVTAMAFQSRRFVPLAILASTVPLAMAVGGLAGRFGRGVTNALCAAVVLGVGWLAWWNLQPYRPDHPVRTGTTVFDRMHTVSDYFPVSAGRFLADNRLSGNAFTAWEWEGYLRWVHPGIRVMVGGRAQQIYPFGVLQLWTRIFSTEHGPWLLRENQVPLAIVSPSMGFTPLMSRLAATREWVGIYNDGRVMVLADARAEATAPLIRRALAGQLEYPSEMTRALSLATCLTTGGATPDPAAILAAVRRANLARPTPQAYEFLAGPGFGDDAVAYLEAESRRLADLPMRGKGSQDLRLCRGTIAAVLGVRYRAAGREAEARQAEERAAALAGEARAIWAAWR